MITIVQQYDSNYKRIADLTIDNKIHYATKHGHIFLNYSCELPKDVPWYWHNTLGILKAIEDDRTRGDWIFWTDPDSLFMNYDFDIQTLIKNIDSKINIIASLWTMPTNFILMDIASTLIKKPTDPLMGMIHQIHTGNFLIRRSKEAVNLLIKIYEDNRFKNNPEIIITAGDEGVYALYYMSSLKLKEMFKLLPTDIFCTLPPESFNYLTKYNLLKYTNIKLYTPGDFILHALGRWKTMGTVENWKYEILKPHVKGIR